MARNPSALRRKRLSVVLWHVAEPCPLRSGDGRPPATAPCRRPVRPTRTRHAWRWSLARAVGTQEPGEPARPRDKAAPVQRRHGTEPLRRAVKVGVQSCRLDGHERRCGPPASSLRVAGDLDGDRPRWRFARPASSTLAPPLVLGAAPEWICCSQAYRLGMPRHGVPAARGRRSSKRAP